MIKISVITVSYNAVKTIEETILSIIKQSYPYIEYIIIDGGSNDGTIDIINKYSSQISYWISEPDKGIYDAMNKGLEVATGDWCIFMGADDIFYDNNIIKNVIINMNNKNNIYYGNVILKNKRQIYPGNPINSVFKICKQNICHQAIFYPYSIYKTKKYNTEYKVWADYIYNLELYSKNASAFTFIDKIISIFNDQGVSINRDPLFEARKWTIFKELFGFPFMFCFKIAFKLNNILKFRQA